MTKQMQYTINQLREELFKPVFDVYAIFKNHFGEDKTDLQGIPTDADLEDIVYITTDIGSIGESFELSQADIERIKTRLQNTTSDILVWWPEVTITNENDRSTVIYDLYAKIELKPDGTIPAENRGFQLNKATYTCKQFISGYQHSHTPSVSRSATAIWQNPCLGSGPINSTIVTLKTDCDEMTWMLFCEELSRYVTVESLKGIPYIKLESIGGSREDYSFKSYLIEEYDNLYSLRITELEYTCFKDYLKEFILFYLKNGNLSLNYCSNKFVPGMPFYNYIIDLSNNFITWVNDNCTVEQCANFAQHKIFYTRIVRGNKILIPSSIQDAELRALGTVRVLKFKNQEINLKILPDAADETVTISTLLDPTFALFILRNILHIINYRFTNGNTTNTSEHSSAATPTYKTVIYI